MVPSVSQLCRYLFLSSLLRSSIFLADNDDSYQGSFDNLELCVKCYLFFFHNQFCFWYEIISLCTTFKFQEARLAIDFIISSSPGKHSLVMTSIWYLYEFTLVCFWCIINAHWFVWLLKAYLLISSDVLNFPEQWLCNADKSCHEPRIRLK